MKQIIFNFFYLVVQTQKKSTFWCISPSVKNVCALLKIEFWFLLKNIDRKQESKNQIAKCMFI